MNRTLPRIVFLSLLALGGSLSAQTPMVGNYTLGPTGQYTTFQAAADDLVLNGVAGPVTFLVSPGPYVESFTLKYVATASATNTITFKSVVPLMAKLTGTAGPTVTFATGTSSTWVSWYILDGFEFTSGPGNALYAHSYVRDIEVKNCDFKAAHVTYLIYGQSGNLQRFSFHDNTFAFIPGGRGFYMSQCSEWKIFRNTVDLNDCAIGFYMINTNSAKNQYFNNIIFGKLRDSASNCVMNITLSQYDINISHNTFIVDTGVSPARIIYGGGCCTTRMIYVYNNIFVNLGAGPCLQWNSQTNLTAYYRGDGNIFWRPGATAVVVGMVGSSTSTGIPYDLPGWQTVAAGYDTMSKVADPLLLPLPAPQNIIFTPASPAKDAAVPYLAAPSYPLFDVADDYFGTPRGTLRDIGAYELPGAGFFPYGAGCMGSGSFIPAIGYTGTVAVGSANFAVTAANGLGGAPALLFLGTTNVSWLGVPLPFAFGGGCNLYQDFVAALGIGLSGTGAGNGAGSLPLPIPNNPALAGGTFFVQWLIADPGAANPFGFVSTQGAKVSL